MQETYRINKDFLWRRLHSLTGLFIALFLMEHLLVNSRAALLVGDDGWGFIKAVNEIHDLPYLPFLEFFLLGVPIVVHMYWGIVYLQSSAQNYYGSDMAKPILNTNLRNKAYTWQRITSWILLVGVIAHVVHMRFLEYPASAQVGETKNYMLRLSKDPGLETLAARLGFSLYDRQSIQDMNPETGIQNTAKTEDFRVFEQSEAQQRHWLEVLRSFHLKEQDVVAVTPSFGMAELLLIRETFKIPLMMALYTLFVLAACYHAFNGLWTFLIKWGITLTEKSQSIMKNISIALMVLIATWGLSAIWITYWINLKH